MVVMGSNGARKGRLGVSEEGWLVAIVRIRKEKTGTCRITIPRSIAEKLGLRSGWAVLRGKRGHIELREVVLR